MYDTARGRCVKPAPAVTDVVQTAFDTGAVAFDHFLGDEAAISWSTTAFDATDQLRRALAAMDDDELLE